MTPGSAGGELGDHGALRRDATIPGLVISTLLPQFAHPATSSTICFCQPREEFEEHWLGSIYHGSARHPAASLSTVIQTWKCRWVERPSRSCYCGGHVQAGSRLADKQAAGLGSATLNGTDYWSCCRFRLRAPWDRAPLCMPCVNILPGTVEWTHVMQVKYKLQAVVNNCDIICTLNFSLLICCGICYNGSQESKLPTVWQYV